MRTGNSSEVLLSNSIPTGCPSFMDFRIIADIEDKNPFRLFMPKFFILGSNGH